MVFLEAASFPKNHPPDKKIFTQQQRGGDETKTGGINPASAEATLSCSVYDERLASETRFFNHRQRQIVVNNNVIDFWDANNNNIMVSATSHIASEEFLEKCCPKNKDVVKCHIDVEVDGGEKRPPVKLVLELYPKHLPKACTNFLALCHGGLSLHGRKMQFKDSLLHEIIPDWCVVGGDFRNGNGSGGRSIFDGNEFEDETFDATDYDQEGLVCNLSHGPNTNTSIFFITLKPADWIKGLYVAFGKVVEGLDDLKALAKEVGTPSGVPSKKVKITSCGLL